ncbi:MAG: ABC transporter ATP-binding protein [Asticcacaulis sp.]|uniref:ABC transporter ATP-binding protein n=1 Tax=Asticcacaulis sp. TaxID=1872648 RepID=UPI003F7C00EA
MPPCPAIITHGLNRRFGAWSAVTDVDLTVEAGQIYGFLGHNGAGKTTTIRLLLGLLRPSGGKVLIFGHDLARERRAAARLTGSLLDASAAYHHLTGYENLDLTRRLLDLRPAEIDRVLEIVDLTASAQRYVRNYSLGMRQRLGLARALLGNPRLLVLDEPLNGLDPDGIHEMRAILRRLCDAGVTLFMSSHLLSEVQQTATHIGLMQDGRLVAQGAVTDLLERLPSDLIIRGKGPVDSVLRQAGYAPQDEDASWRIALTGGPEQAASINRRLVEAGCDISEISIRRATLESFYLRNQGKVH